MPKSTLETTRPALICTMDLDGLKVNVTVTGFHLALFTTPTCIKRFEFSGVLWLHFSQQKKYIFIRS